MSEKRLRFRLPKQGREAALVILHARLEKGERDLPSLFIQNLANCSSEDAAFARALVYGTLTRLYTIDWILQKRSHEKWLRLDPWVRTNLRAAIWQLRWSHVPSAVVCHEAGRWVSAYLHEGAVRYVNACLRAELREPTVLPTKNLALQYSLLPELAGYFKAQFGTEGAKQQLEALLELPPLTIRVNRRKTTAEKLKADLESQGIHCEPGSFLSEAITLQLQGRSLTSLSSFQKGEFFVQGEAAMAISSFVDWQALENGAAVLDLCSAPGGKTTALLEQRPDLFLTAQDLQPDRLDRVRENLERLGFLQTDSSIGTEKRERIRLRVADATFEPSSDEIQHYALVLADVPCSGLGLLGRKPDIRTTMTHERIQSLLPLQASILDRAASLVRVGGELFYSTCTLSRAENQEQVEAFCLRHPEFQRIDLSNRVPSRLAAKLSPLQREELSRGEILFTPADLGCEGFYLAVLGRTVCSE